MVTKALNLPPYMQSHHEAPLWGQDALYCVSITVNSTRTPQTTSLQDVTMERQPTRGDRLAISPCFLHVSSQLSQHQKAIKYHPNWTWRDGSTIMSSC